MIKTGLFASCHEINDFIKRCATATNCNKISHFIVWTM
jgi:hypothetical protein